MSDRVYIPLPGGPSPSDLPDLGAIIPRQAEPVKAPRPQPMGSLVAAAARLTSEHIGRSKGRRASSEGWQEDAWEMYDLVGELRFVTNLLANQQAKARFYVGRIADNPDDPPVPVDDPVLRDALASIGGGPGGLAQLVKRLAVNLQIPGDGWLIGVPKDLMPDADDETPAVRNADGSIPLSNLVWHALSVTEVSFPNKDKVEVVMGDDAQADKITARPDDLWLIRVWNPHPRRFWQADSATRSALPILRELVGLTMHISAQIDSRLAGAGVLLVPASASEAAKRERGLPVDSEEDPFTEALIQAMMTPISDRSNASAYVPLVWTVPDDTVQHFKYLMQQDGRTLDAQAKEMRDDSIRRYALSADAPPELLLGVGGMNHWGAWLVQEDTVRAHIEPPLALLCDAFTTQFIRVLMREIGTYSDEEINRTVVWYDVEHLIVRAGRKDEARDAHAAGVISDEAYRTALGFGEEDAPKSDLDPAVQMALDLVSKSPALANSPGLPALVRQLREVLEGRDPSVPALAPAPSTDTAPAGPPEEIPDPVAAELAGIHA